MKKIFALSLALILAFGIIGPTAANAACETTPQVVTLFAGQTIDVGTVTVDNDANYLYVSFETTGDWWLQQTHLHVADSLAGIPTNNNGNPQIGHFAYQTTHDPRVQSYTYTIPKGALSLDANDSVVIAAHAEVVRIVDGEVVQSETGWGDGDRFVDRGSWATYFSYIWQDCDGGPDSGTETAFAYGGSWATCFLDIDADNDGFGDFDRWGWTNGPLSAVSYTFDIYAGAGQCDLSKGTLVGTLSVVYSNGTAVVTFNTSGTNSDTSLPYTMVETHLYVGSAILPLNNGSYTVAPGQYPTIHGELANVTSDSYTITGLSGDIYVVAHAVVAGFPVE